MENTNSAVSGFWDNVGSFLEKGAAVATTVYTTKAQADAAKAQAKADAERAKADAAQAKQTAATPAAASPGGIPPVVLYTAAAALGLGVIIWAATRKA